MSLARFFQRPHYRSDTTDFINDLKNARPELDEQQVQGRALLWDKELDRQQQAEVNAGNVQPTAYVYYAYSDQQA